MITSAKNFTKDKQTKKNGQTEPSNLHREAYTYTLRKREKGNIYIYLYIKKKGREQPNQETNLPVIINSKY